MKTKTNLLTAGLLLAAFGNRSAAAAENSADTLPAKTSAAIPWSQIGAKAGVDYQGDGLAVFLTAEGARLRCGFQRFEGEATREGLWLTSTIIPPNGTVNDRFRIVATEVGRVTPCAPPSGASVRASRLVSLAPAIDGAHGVSRPTMQLANSGTVSLDGQTVRFIRPALTEEYTVSTDGVRQDFVVLERPAGAGDLAVRLAVSGVKVEPAAAGAQLVLENSGRMIAYSRLRVTDATGKELSARMEVESDFTASDLEADVAASRQSAAVFNSDDGGALPSRRYAPMLVVVVNDADAVYPLRIDPTFSDANWISMGGFPGANGEVRAAVVDGSGNLYIGGHFTLVGDVFATNIAKWNGSSWSALGPGVGGSYGYGVYALAVSGSNVYAGGDFTTAGGSAVSYIAKWNGSNWSALVGGMDGRVYALSVSGSDVYASSPNNGVVKWNGSSWSALGSGPGIQVHALAVSGGDVYAGGYYGVAKWNGISWSGLGSGIDSVYALAVSGSNVYAGGLFTTAGGDAANYIAKWNGTSWSGLGSGMGGDSARVFALAVSGNNLYAGGWFWTAGGTAANHIAKWNGSSWSGLGSGLVTAVGGVDLPGVYALAVSGNDLYVGGDFTTAGGKVSAHIARAYLPTLPTLSLLRSGSEIMVSWPSADTVGFMLEQAATQALPATWVANTANVTDDGTNKSVTLSATNRAQFFRLSRP